MHCSGHSIASGHVAACVVAARDSSSDPAIASRSSSRYVPASDLTSGHVSTRDIASGNPVTACNLTTA